MCPSWKQITRSGWVHQVGKEDFSPHTQHKSEKEAKRHYWKYCNCVNLILVCNVAQACEWLLPAGCNMMQISSLICIISHYLERKPHQSQLVFIRILYLGRVGNLRSCFLWREENQRIPRKTLRARREPNINKLKLNLLMALDQNWNQATLIRDKCSHQSAIPGPTMYSKILIIN